jgi:hypothetical protein
VAGGIFVAGLFMMHRGHKAIDYYSKYESCIENALPVGGGHRLGVCETEGHTTWSATIVYDSSDQILLPSSSRSELWDYSFLRQSPGFAVEDLTTTRITGEFFLVLAEEGILQDSELSNFMTSHKCYTPCDKSGCKKLTCHYTPSPEESRNAQ